ncbi:MAG: hypothetical protein Q7T25_00540 [Sideroxyarcus sp.]|nr:hypothetical protein [Sideroxyarcus sp.]
MIDDAREVRKSIKRIHKAFLEECRNAGVKPNEYPLNQAMAGLRSLASYFKRYDNQTFESAARSAGVDRVGPAPPAEIEQAPPATRTFEVVEFDGHKIDLRVTVRVIDPFGFETLLELTRIWILVLLDVASRAVIGYKLALSKEYNKDDTDGFHLVKLRWYCEMVARITPSRWSMQDVEHFRVFLDNLPDDALCSIGTVALR